MHLLHIDGYSAAERMVQQGKFIESRTFSTGGHKVVAALLPQRLRQQIRGRTQRRHQIRGRTATAVELELMKRSYDDDVVAAYGLSVLGRDDNPALSYTVGPQRFNRGSCYNHYVAVLVTPEERQAAMRLDVKENDTLAVRCDLTVTRFDEESRLKWYLRKLLD
jgi:hypothetical protein